MNMDQENSVEVIDDDVFYMMSLVGKKVRIQTIENSFVEGVVFVIDPIYKTVVLCDDTKIRILIYISIKSLEEISKDVVEQTFLEKPPPRDIGSWKNLEKRADRVVEWFRLKNIHAVKKGENIMIDEHVSIEPPYTEETCYCKSTMVLEKMQNILKMMPSDFT